MSRNRWLVNTKGSDPIHGIVSHMALVCPGMQ